MRRNNLFLLFLEEDKFTKHGNKDCLYGNDIHSMDGDRANDHPACQDWCWANSNCGGFAVDAFNGCYFKNQSCSSDIINKGGVDLYLKIIV